MSEARYSSVAIILHWVIALLILGQIAGGFYMHNLPYASPIKFDLYQLHKSFGFSILALSLFRLGWRLSHRPPALPAAMPAWEKLAARSAHLGFYILMIGAPLIGWAMVSASPTDIPTKFFGVISVPHLPIGVSETKEDFFKEIHELFAYGVLFLLALHVGAALKHRFLNKDHVLQSMTPFRASQWIGVAAVFTVLIAGSIVYSFAPPLNANTGSVSSMQSNESNWAVDYERSSLKFIGEEKGRQFTGVFQDFSADIVFFEDDLNASSVTVTVTTGSAMTGDSIRDSTIPGEEWFNTDSHPTAIFQSTSIRQLGDGQYEANGMLAVKSYERPVTLRFDLIIDGDNAVATGGADVIRTDFGLGLADAWLEDEQVQQEVRIAFEIFAARAN
ncbi:cytochrome b/b6 domain-containing protein [Hyphococcus flavus]|uniref:Cytochrome b/b6 domain-containing protein n=1 Tax=Hyphococcus flavus TaxID=1866326 RepID=A0AAF0CGY8_9PROT|nr:cytochrome b/b6 domain-containing protein [Hyphococcus flavus]WDI31287.1 cytochrome b/b6 domain-containing protein [Hyphococcus flavus]